MTTNRYYLEHASWVRNPEQRRMSASDASDAQVMALREAIKESAWRVLGMHVKPRDLLAIELGEDDGTRLTALRIIADAERAS